MEDVNMNKKLNSAIVLLYILWMCTICTLIFIFKEKLFYNCKIDFLLSESISMVLIAFGTLSILYLICIYKEQAKGLLKVLNDNDALLKWLSLFLCLLQIYVCYNIYFESGWDVGAILRNARKIVSHDNNGLSNTYFSHYPNNFLLLSFISFLLSINEKFGILDTETGIMTIITVQCILSSIIGYLLFKVIYYFTKRRALSWFGWIIYLILVGSSSWLTIPYSDSLGIIFPIGILYLLTHIYQGKKMIRNGILSVVLLSTGYLLKPQILIVGIAVLIVVSIKIFGATPIRDKLKIVGEIVILTGIILVFIKLCSLGFLYWAGSVGYQIDQNIAMGPSHYFMMGLNPDTDGVYSSDDCGFSFSITDKKLRTSENVRVAVERIKEYGPLGVVKHCIKKTLVNYGDGTFFFGGEGTFYKIVYPEKNSYISQKLRDFFWRSGNGYMINATIKQFVWLFVLVISIGNARYLFKKDEISSDLLYIVLLSIIGSGLFQLLFEARSRYLYIYAPYFIILAMTGLEGAYHTINKFYNRRINIHIRQKEV
jgi:hypothetical protein